MPIGAVDTCSRTALMPVKKVALVEMRWQDITFFDFVAGFRPSPRTSLHLEPWHFPSNNRPQILSASWYKGFLTSSSNQSTVSEAISSDLCMLATSGMSAQRRM